MPVYNCELYIREAVDSILNQTFADFEFLIIDDASIDATATIIKKYNDPRIQLIEKPENSGYTNSLNYGLSIAKGEYIARMDGDDISLPERFAKQVAFLDANKDIILCGTSLCIIGTDKTIIVPETHDAIKLALLKGNSIVHPSVMFRNIKEKKSLIGYDISKEPAEDYDLWVRLLSRGKLHNLQEVLLNYRVHNTQVSQKREKQQINSALETRLNILGYLNCTIELNERNLLKKIIQHNDFFFNEIEEFLVLKNKLIVGNETGFFGNEGFLKYLSELENKILKSYFLKRGTYSPIIYFQYLKVNNNSQLKLIPLNQIKLFVKSIIFYKAK